LPFRYYTILITKSRTHLFVFPTNTAIQILCTDFNSILLHVSAVCFGHHHTRILVHKHSKKWEMLVLTNSGYNVIVKFIIITPKTE